MKNRVDLITATLKLLNAIAAGQDPTAEDVDAVDEVIDGKIAELSARGLFYSGDPNEFDDQYLDPLSVVIANTCAPTFGQPRNPDSALAAEAILRQMVPSTYVPMSTLAVDYF